MMYQQSVQGLSCRPDAILQTLSFVEPVPELHNNAVNTGFRDSLPGDLNPTYG